MTARDGVLDIDTPAGLTLWFKTELHGPVLIEYEAEAVSTGGANDRVSDLNCFWMATDPRSPAGPPSAPRTGAFADYNNLRAYYVGLGGNGNTTTRFRRYIGSETERPLLPENDRSSPHELLQPNRFQVIRLVANGGLIQYYRDDQRLFEYVDPKPYTRGWFAIRTTKSHLRIRHFKVYAIAAGRAGRALSACPSPGHVRVRRPPGQLGVRPLKSRIDLSENLPCRRSARPSRMFSATARSFMS